MRRRPRFPRRLHETNAQCRLRSQSTPIDFRDSTASQAAQGACGRWMPPKEQSTYPLQSDLHEAVGGRSSNHIRRLCHGLPRCRDHASPAERVHSTRFHNVSTTGVDSRGLAGTGVEKVGPSFQSRFDLLAEKNERHRLVRECLRFEFESLSYVFSFASNSATSVCQCRSAAAAS
jgi:hypothetical protein